MFARVERKELAVVKAAELAGIWVRQDASDLQAAPSRGRQRAGASIAWSASQQSFARQGAVRSGVAVPGKSMVISVRRWRAKNWRSMGMN
jgi:hypothetical protein